MNRLILILILTFSFQTLTKADDIRDFEVEGISIGGSALDYFSKEEILKEIESNKFMYEYTTNKFGEVYKYKDLEKYHFISFFVKPNDNKFIIHGIRGTMPHVENINLCHDEMNEVASIVSKMFGTLKKNENSWDHPIDKTGRSKVKEIEFIFSQKGEITIMCLDFEEKLRIKNNWIDGLDVGILTNEVIDWLSQRN
jgi:hypothetical protein